MKEVFEALEKMGCATLVEDYSVRDIYEDEYNVVNNALQRLKAIESKVYLKWEDLEKNRTYKVLLNGVQYELVKHYDDYEYSCDVITLQKSPNIAIFISEYEKEIFNDLHLEEVKQYER